MDVWHAQVTTPATLLTLGDGLVWDSLVFHVGRFFSRFTHECAESIVLGGARGFHQVSLFVPRFPCPLSSIPLFFPLHVFGTSLFLSLM